MVIFRIQVSLMVRQLLRPGIACCQQGVGLAYRYLGFMWLGLALTTGAVAQETGSTATEGWQFTRTADPIAGGAIAMASVSAPSADALVRCWTKSRELDVRFLLAPGTGRAASTKVTVGFDKRRNRVRTWRLSPSGLALVVPPAQRGQILQRLRGASDMRLFVQTDSQAQTDSPGTELNIPLTGSSRAIAAVLRACN